MCTVGTFYGKSKLEMAIDTMMDVFFKYSSKYSDKYKLDFLELRKLIQTELSDYVKNSWDARNIGYIMDDLDKNHDGRVSFEEFIFLMGQVAILSHPMFKDYTPSISSCGQFKDGRLQS